MDRLQDKFEDRVDFFHLDFDKEAEKTILREFDIRQRSTYVLLDADGNIVKAWAGYLDEELVATELEAALSQL